jgi:hypothetical protein
MFFTSSPLRLSFNGLKKIYIHPTPGEVNASDGHTKYRNDLDELLGNSTSSMDFGADYVHISRLRKS